MSYVIMAPGIQPHNYIGHIEVEIIQWWVHLSLHVYLEIGK